MWMEQLVSGWLALELTDSAWLVAVNGFFRMAPLLIIGFISGAIADRFGRRRVILFSQTINLLVPAILLLLVLTKQIRFWHLPVASAIIGSVWALDWPTRRSLLPDLVGKERVTEGILLEGVFQNIARIVGPYAAGVIIEYLGASGCFAVLALLSAIGLIILFGLSKPPRHAEGERPSRISVKESVRYIVQKQSILGVLLVSVVMNLLFFPHATLLPVFARDILGQGSVGLGLMSAGYGIGAFMGLVLLNRIRRMWQQNRIFVAGSAFQAALLVLFAFSTSFPLSVAALVLAGLGQASFAVLQSSIVLGSASDKLRSRTMGMLNLSIGVGALGRMQMGAIASSFGAPLAVGLSCIAAILLMLLIITVLPGFRKKEM